MAQMAAGRPAQISISSRRGSIEIDSSQGRREMGYLSMRELSEDLRDRGLRAASAATAAIAGRGDSFVASLRGGGNAVASMAFDGMLRDVYESEFRFNIVPLSPPAIYVDPGAMSIDFVY